MMIVNRFGEVNMKNYSIHEKNAPFLPYHAQKFDKKQKNLRILLQNGKKCVILPTVDSGMEQVDKTCSSYLPSEQIIIRDREVLLWQMQKIRPK